MSREINQPTVERKHPYPPEITEHPTWKRVWKILLTPRPDDTSADERDERAA